MAGIPLRIIDAPDREAVELQPGDCWRDHGCWAVVLPNGEIWYSGLPSASGAYWTTTGEAPNLTVTPSIDDQDPRNPWHGWIRDGELVQVQA